jgi:hypothetical protein
MIAAGRDFSTAGAAETWCRIGQLRRSCRDPPDESSRATSFDSLKFHEVFQWDLAMIVRSAARG